MVFWAHEALRGGDWASSIIYRPLCPASCRPVRGPRGPLGSGVTFLARLHRYRVPPSGDMQGLLVSPVMLLAFDGL